MKRKVNMRFWLIMALSMQLAFVSAMGQPVQDNNHLRGSNLKNARAFLDKNKEDSALYYLDKCIAENASDQEALFLRARIYSNHGYLEKAHGDYNALIALNPLQKEAVYSRGIIRYQLSQFENALEDFEAALELPNGATQTAFFRMEGNSVAGISTINNMEADIWNNIGLCYYQLTKYESSVHAYSQGIELNPKKSDLFVNRALAWEELGETSLAIDDYEVALATTADHSIAAYNLMRLKKAPKVHELHELDNFISDNPEFAPGYNSRGLYYYNLGKYGLASRDFKVAVELDPENVNYLFNQALCHEKQNNIASAESLFIRIIEIDSRHSGAYFNLGNMQFKQRAFEEAISYFTLAHHSNPENMDILYNRALSFQKNGQLDLACEDMEKVQKSDYPLAQKFINKYCLVKP